MKTIAELEKDYDLELDKVILEIKKKKAKLVLLQFPDGLKPYATAVVDYLEEKTSAEFIIWLDTCYGACDTPILGNLEEKIEVFREKWLGKTRPNGRLITKTSVCTDCHGTHNYIPQNVKSDPAEPGWISLFSGRNLKGWETAGDSIWSVKAARLIAVPDTSKQRNVIRTAHEYADFQISITFRASWPVNAWVSLRQQEHISGPYVAIFDSAKPTAQPGSIWLSDEKLALANLRESVVERLTWNTLLIEAKQDRYSTWLNKQKIGFCENRVGSGL